MRKPARPAPPLARQRAQCTEKDRRELDILWRRYDRAVVAAARLAHHEDGYLAKLVHCTDLRDRIEYMVVMLERGWAWSDVPPALLPGAATPKVST